MGPPTRRFADVLHFAQILLLIVASTIPLTACGTIFKAEKQKLLPDGYDEFLRQLAFDLRKESGPGLAYLEKTGLDLIIMIPSMEQMHALMKAQHEKGEIDDAAMRSYDKALKATPPQERGLVKFEVARPGFESSTTLPRPYGLKSQNDQTINISENFMQRFQVTTEFDLRRIIRDSSIILSNFTGPNDQDYFDIHYQRLLQVLDSEAALAEPSSEARTSATLNFTASLMIIDALLPPTNTILTTEDYYTAALVIGTVYALF